MGSAPLGTYRLSRRSVLGAAAGAALGADIARDGMAQDATPDASSVAGEWTYTDVTGTTVTLPGRPVRIAAYINQAASLWDFGIQPVAVFGWTAANYPDGDHIAWGNVPAGELPQISDLEGNVDLEQLIAANPDLIVTWTWNKDDIRNATNGFPADVLDRAAEIAPIIVVNQGDPIDVELGRIEALAEALGADLNAPALVADREAYETKVAEFQTAVTERSELTAIFASYGEDGVYYVASPDYVADVGYLRSLGLQLANDGSPTATAYWEEISTEQALMYPSDLVYLDAYGSANTLEAVQALPVINQHPAIAAGQVGYWHRDFPLTYQGIATFLEDVLTPLRTAEKVTG